MKQKPVDILEKADTIEIAVSMSGVLPTDNYANLKPFYSIKGTFPKGIDVDEVLDVLRKKVNERLEVDYNNAIARRLKNMGFREKGGKQYPRVSSIINQNTKFFMPKDELLQHGARGHLYDLQLAEYIKTNEWKVFNKIPECYKYLDIVKKGNLKLTYDEMALMEFFKKYPVKFNKAKVEVFNDEYLYAGEYDFDGEILKEGDWIKLGGVEFNMPTMFDLKIGSPDRIKPLKQESAYAKCDGLEHIKQICTINLTDKNICGYAKPKVSQNIDDYFRMFLQDRTEF